MVSESLAPSEPMTATVADRPPTTKLDPEPWTPTWSLPLVPLTMTESALPSPTPEPGGADLLFGGAGNDVLTGGSGDDQVFGEAGNDRMVWNPGEGTDLNEGGDGNDTVEVNGGNGAESFTATANGSRVRFDRLDPAPFTLDIGTSENLVVNMNGGDDTFTGSNGLAGLISLTVDGGTLACEGAGAVTFTVGGTTYAVNGMASGNGQWPDIDPIWAKGSDTPKKDIGPLIDRGLQLCG